MKFAELLNKLHISPPQKITDFEINKLSLDSRNIENKDIFFALKGTESNGELYIGKAVENGARAVFVSENFTSEKPIQNLIRVQDIKNIMHKAAEVFYTNLPENLIAVTGTNGKTSVVNFISQILFHLGQKSISVGTLGFLKNGNFDDKYLETNLTSPDVLTLYKSLSNLKKQGYNYAAIETSSHGLHQNRFGNLKFSVCCFTNFSQDHLDYHKTMEEYFAAKSLLFSSFAAGGAAAVLNSDIAEYDKLSEICEQKNLRILDYGKNVKSLKILNSELTNSGIKLNLSFEGREYIINTKIYGDFQVYNICCAILAVYSLGFKIEDIIIAAQNVRSVRGRMEVVNFKNKKASAVIDYAHTPDALEKAILACRKHASGKLVTLFGCGGDRDKTKRPLMGKIASENSDEVIVTDDNPRTEDAENIRAEILLKCPNAKEIGDRKEAIIYCLKNLNEGDVLLIAGKGHEDYQIIGDVKHHFSDVEIVEEFINRQG